MKPEEAIEKLEEVPIDYYALPVGNASHIKALDDIRNAFITANKALQKQIPKKPVTDYKNIFEGTGYKLICYSCPKCGGFVGEYENDMPGAYNVNYCQDCGQRIDWTEQGESE